jgi:hypothetical protein
VRKVTAKGSGQDQFHGVSRARRQLVTDIGEGHQAVDRVVAIRSDRTNVQE